MEKRKIVRGIILVVLLVCTAFLIYSIVTDPLGEHDIMFALAITAGFLALGQDKKNKTEYLEGEGKICETNKNSSSTDTR